MNQIHVDTSAEVATVQTGATQGAVVTALGKIGYAIPSGGENPPGSCGCGLSWPYEMMKVGSIPYGRQGNAFPPRKTLQEGKGRVDEWYARSRGTGLPKQSNWIKPRDATKRDRQGCCADIATGIIGTPHSGCLRGSSLVLPRKNVDG
nr:hypothetical protein [Ktedonospora formicarum]